MAQRRLFGAGAPVREVAQACDRHATTGANSRRHAASDARSTAGVVSAGYAYHSAAPPLARDARKVVTAAAEAPTRNQSHLRSRDDFNALRGPEPKPHASMDSASCIY